MSGFDEGWDDGATWKPTPTDEPTTAAGRAAAGLRDALADVERALALHPGWYTDDLDAALAEARREGAAEADAKWSALPVKQLEAVAKAAREWRDCPGGHHRGPMVEGLRYALHRLDEAERKKAAETA